MALTEFYSHFQTVEFNLKDNDDANNDDCLAGANCAMFILYLLCYLHLFFSRFYLWKLWLYLSIFT